MPEKVRVFIGTGPRFEEPTEILKYSILSITDPTEVEIHEMKAWDRDDPSGLWSNWPGQPTEENFGRVRGNWVTPFSLFRYAIPAMCGFEGYAIYLDCDMIVLDDIRKLYEHRKPGKWCIAPNRDGDCVTVMDCSAVQMPFLSVKGGYLGNKHGLRKHVQPYISRTIPEEWNHCDQYKVEVSKLVHYTSMKTQPWHPYPEALNYEPHPDAEAVALYNGLRRDLQSLDLLPRR